MEISQMNIINLREICCRTCLRTDGFLFSLTAEDEVDDVKISYKLTTCISHIEWLGENLPNFICTKCLEFLRISYDFRKSCISTNDTIQILLEKPTAPELQEVSNEIINEHSYLECTINDEILTLDDFSDNDEVMTNDIEEIKEEKYQITESGLPYYYSETSTENDYSCSSKRIDVYMPKTPAERAREYRARKKLLKPPKPPAKTVAQRKREFRARQKALKNAVATIGDDDVNMPKTPADRAREYRARKKLLKQPKPPAKTAAQCQREYRARKKALKMNVATIGKNETETNRENPQPRTIRDDGSILYNYLSQTGGQEGQEKIQAVNSTSITTTRTRKSSAQRCREYRQRKKAREDAMAIVVQRPVVSPATNV